MHNHEPVPGSHYTLRKPGTTGREEVTSLPESTEMWCDLSQKMDVKIFVTYCKQSNDEIGKDKYRQMMRLPQDALELDVS